MDRKNDDIDGPLLTDDELTELLDAEYQAHGRDLTAAEKAAGFAALERRLSAAEVTFWGRWSGPLAMAALLALGIVPVLMKHPHDDGMRIKGDGPTIGFAARLEAYFLAEPLAPVPVDADGKSPVPLGQTIVFKAMLPAAGQVGLVLVSGEKPASLRAVMRVSEAGVPTLIEQGDHIFGYRFDEPRKPLRVCAIAESDARKLEVLMNTFDAAHLDRSACVDLVPEGGG